MRMRKKGLRGELADSFQAGGLLMVERRRKGGRAEIELPFSASRYSCLDHSLGKPYGGSPTLEVFHARLLLPVS